jgi:hypothetical protein
MMTFPMRAKVECMDGPDGELTAVIIDPAERRVTSLVVRHRNVQRLVPVAYVANSSEHTIRLHCSDSEMQAMEQFSERRFVRSEHPETPRAMAYQHPQGVPMDHSPHGVPQEAEMLPVEIEHVPARERIIHYGARVEATDGPIGHVSELQVGQDGSHINRLVARSGSILRKCQKSFPLIAIDHFEDDLVYLRWDRSTLEQLPGVHP